MFARRSLRIRASGPMASKGVRTDKRLVRPHAEGLTALFCRQSKTSTAFDMSSCVGDSPRASVGDGATLEAPPTPSLKSEDTQHDVHSSLAIEDGGVGSTPPRANASTGTGSSSAPAALPLSPAASPLANGMKRPRVAHDVESPLSARAVVADSTDPGIRTKPTRRIQSKTTLPAPIRDRILKKQNY